jgi:hypothetical protein
MLRNSICEGQPHLCTTLRRVEPTWNETRTYQIRGPNRNTDTYLLLVQSTLALHRMARWQRPRAFQCMSYRLLLHKHGGEGQVAIASAKGAFPCHIIANLQVTPLSFFFRSEKKRVRMTRSVRENFGYFSFWRGLAEFPLQILRRAQ